MPLEKVFWGIAQAVAIVAFLWGSVILFGRIVMAEYDRYHRDDQK